MNEKIVKKSTEPSMQLGPSASFFGKLNQHMNDCHAAESYLKDKLNENDFSWIPLLSSEVEELWKKFQEEYTVVQVPSSLNLKVKLSVGVISRYLMLSYFPANQKSEPHIVYLTAPSDYYYSQIGEFVSEDVMFSTLSTREKDFVYGERRHDALKRKYENQWLTIQYGVTNALKKTLNKTFFKKTVKSKFSGDYELLFDITIKNLKAEKWDSPSNVLFLASFTKIEGE